MLVYKGGDYYIHVTVGSKGGRERFARIIGTKEEKEKVIKMMRDAGEQKVFEAIPERYSYHILRSIYACRFIDLVAANTVNIREKDKYHFKKSGGNSRLFIAEMKARFTLLYDNTYMYHKI